MHCNHDTDFLPTFPLWNVMWEALDRPCCSQGRSYEAGFAGSDLCTVLCKKKDCNAWKPYCRPKFSFKCLMIGVLKPDFSYRNSWTQFKKILCLQKIFLQRSYHVVFSLYSMKDVSGVHLRWNFSFHFYCRNMVKINMLTVFITLFFYLMHLYTISRYIYA